MCDEYGIKLKGYLGDPRDIMKLEARRATGAREAGAKARVGAGAARGLGSGVGGVPSAQRPEWNEVVVAVAHAVVRACDARSSKGGIFRLVEVVELLLAQLFKGSAVVTEQNDVLIQEIGRLGAVHQRVRTLTQIL